MSHFFLFMEENLELCKLESPAFLRNVISGLLRFSVSDVTSKSKKNRLEQFSCISLQLHRDFYSYTPRKSCDIWSLLGQYLCDKSGQVSSLWILQSLTNCIWPSIVISMRLHKKKIGIKCAIFQSCLPHHYIPQLHPQCILWIKTSSQKIQEKQSFIFPEFDRDFLA